MAHSMHPIPASGRPAFVTRPSASGPAAGGQGAWERRQGSLGGWAGSRGARKGPLLCFRDTLVATEGGREGIRQHSSQQMPPLRRMTLGLLFRKDKPTRVKRAEKQR